jgi:hypothetical protein
MLYDGHFFVKNKLNGAISNIYKTSSLMTKKNHDQIARSRDGSEATTTSSNTKHYKMLVKPCS